MNGTPIVSVRFAPGELVFHAVSGRRGAVLDVDATCSADEQWYRNMAAGAPSRDQPWYTVLVDGAKDAIYVPEDQLDHDASAEPVQHPAVEHVFAEFTRGRYAVRHPH